MVEDSSSVSDSDVQFVPLRTPARRRDKCGHWFVTWAKSQIHGSDQFYEVLKQRLPSGTEIFGCQLDDDKTCYHAVIRNVDFPYWPDPKKTFTLYIDEGTIDTDLVHVVHRPSYRPLLPWLSTMQDYCERVGGSRLFGTRFTEFTDMERRM